MISIVPAIDTIVVELGMRRNRESSNMEFDEGQKYDAANLSWFAYGFSLCELYCGLIAVFICGFLVPSALTFETAFFINQKQAIGMINPDSLVLYIVPATVFLISFTPAIWLIRCSAKVIDRFHGGVAGQSVSHAKRYLHLIPLLIVHRAQKVAWFLVIPLGGAWFVHFLLALVARHTINDFFNGFDLSVAMHGFLVASAYLGFVFACNIYLALSIGVMFRSRTLTRSVWRSRFILDAIVAMFAMFG